MTISWNTWTGNSSGSIVAAGTPVAVSFTTINPHDFVTGAASWLPASTFADGAAVANAPQLSNHIMRLTGGNSAINTLTFSTPVVDPVISMWSLGGSATPTSFIFSSATPLLVAGGPSLEWGGSTIGVTGNTVSGTESNGTVRFAGTYSSLSWTNPTSEFWYGFNVGVASAVPEPSSALMLLAGLAVAVGRARILSARQT